MVAAPKTTHSYKSDGQVCTVCKLSKPLEDFHRNPKNIRTGRDTRCRRCISSRKAKQYKVQRRLLAGKSKRNNKPSNVLNIADFEFAVIFFESSPGAWEDFIKSFVEQAVWKLFYDQN